MHADSTVRINSGLINRITAAKVTALEQTAEALHTDLVQSQTMPRRSGTLQNTQTFVDYRNSQKGSCTIVSSTPYARRLYFHPEYNFSKAENSDAGGKWFEPYIEGEKKDFARQVFKERMKALGGL
ncbi:MAG: hypothetical protein K6G88_05650 [Lachnospiraceae bacterium]|nr:hypothetical protein [Lachnospiraceae bacterium]